VTRQPPERFDLGDLVLIWVYPPNVLQAPGTADR
jgi:hypothetical protein